MAARSFPIQLLVYGSFCYLAVSSADIETLPQALVDIKHREDIGDALEWTSANNGQLKTNIRGHEATDWHDDTILEVQQMLADLNTKIAEDVQQDTHQVLYKVVGCYQDKQVAPRPLPELLADLTGDIDWHDLDKVIQKCAKLTSYKAYTYFGLQSFGHCRSGKDAASTYNRDGPSNGCKTGLGGKGENLVFTIISFESTTPLPTEKSTNIITTDSTKSPGAIPPSRTTTVAAAVTTTTTAATTKITTATAAATTKITTTTAAATTKITTTARATTTAAATTKTTTTTTTSPETTTVTLTTERSTPSISPLTPFECLNYKLLKEANRAEGHSTIFRGAICDRTLSRGWYRFFGDAGDKMPEFCVPKLRCGTHAPGWLSSGHPSMAHGIVDARVCFHWGSNCCYWSADIKVRNCGQFFVYKLHRVPFCRLRYCGDNRVVPILTSTPSPVSSARTPYAAPIECSTYRILNGRDRSQTYKYRSVQGAKPTCDSRLPKAWYRFSGLAGDRMPEKCVPIHRCGTLAPGWLQGAHPAVNDGVVSRTVCFNWGRKCCRWNRKILVRNCGDFYIYNLQRIPVCQLRYCGAREIATPKTTRTSKSTTTSKPTITSPTFPTEPNYGFSILCLPSAMHVRVSKQRLPSSVSPKLLRFDDPSCRVAKMDENNLILATALDSCGTFRRTEGDRVSFHNKIVAESGDRSKRAVFEFPFRCSYKKLSSLGNKFQPINQHIQVMDSTFDVGE